MGKIFVQDLKAGEPVVSYFLVTGKQERQKKTGESFLSLTLGDRTGQVPAVLWDAPEREDGGIAPGRIVKVQGTVGSYQGETQLVIQRIRPVEDGEVSLEDFFPRSARDVGEMVAFLRDTVSSFRNPHLRALLQEMLTDEEFLRDFSTAPGAKGMHHVFLGGLLEHTVSIVTICRFLADHYPGVDRDMLLTSAILHDVGKVRELSWEGAFDYTDRGRLLGHITLGTLLVEERIRRLPDFPPATADELLHNILSHHGEYEWGSPKRPKTLEALILHHVENLDGKVNNFQAFALSHRDPDRPGWTTFHKSLDRYLYLGPSDEDPFPSSSSPMPSPGPDSLL